MWARVLDEVGERLATPWRPKRRGMIRAMYYRDIYLRTKWWQELRRYIHTTRGGRCEKCGTSERLHVHHRRYRLYRERPRDLKLLCATCHLRTHRPSSLRWWEWLLVIITIPIWMPAMIVIGVATGVGGILLLLPLLAFLVAWWVLEQTLGSLPPVKRLDEQMKSAKRRWRGLLVARFEQRRSHIYRRRYGERFHWSGYVGVAVVTSATLAALPT